MRIVMTLCVRNEEDILDTQLRFHYAQGVDFVVATDNNSIDATPEILKRYAAEGRLAMIKETEDNHAQSRWVTRMARVAASDYHADWVVNSDADEFWWPESGDLRSALEAIPWRHGVITAPRVNFPPVAGEDPFYSRMTVRLRDQFDYFPDQPLKGKVCHRARRHVMVAQGNHRVSGRFLREWPGPSPITIFHFPMRSYDQFANKVAVGGAAYARNTESPPKEGRTTKRLFALLRAGELESYYERQRFDGPSVANGLARGELIEDRRLVQFFGAA